MRLLIVVPKLVNGLKNTWGGTFTCFTIFGMLLADQILPPIINAFQLFLWRIRHVRNTKIHFSDFQTLVMECVYL